MPLDEQIGLKVSRETKMALDNLYPDVSERNNVLRALIKKLLNGSISIKSYEIEQSS